MKRIENYRWALAFRLRLETERFNRIFRARTDSFGGSTTMEPRYRTADSIALEIRALKSPSI